ncbi:MAG: alpha-glucan family phosphorylase [Chloroflexi bacterium]|nr:alpha-glucan family phosphorylase [Chloroflexota bacterium]
MRLRAARTLLIEPSLPPALELLRDLSRNLYWTWDTDAAALFERIDRTRWEETGRNPVRMLQNTPLAEFHTLAADEGFLSHLARVRESFATYMARSAQQTVPGTSERNVIAYFSFEFALTESLPNYSGGLGVLAGDHLKSASDLGLPLVGIGLFYRQGYFQQVLGPDGWQREEYTDLDYAGQPLERVRGENSSPLTISVPFDGRDVLAAIWKVRVGQARLYLLDTGVDGNTPVDREITARLYGGDIETRIQQEMVLGIGGVRALHALDLHPAVCHMNEGHSALLGVERIRMLMREAGVSFEEARLPVSAATVFTTHTAVAAGIDLFPSELVRRYLGHYYTEMGLDDRAFIGLGRIDPADDHEPFSMALLGLRLSGYRNGVSRLHRTVSRKLWDEAWPKLPAEQIPIDSVTNGVHLPTWVAHDIGEIYDRYVGRGWRDDPVRPDGWKGIDAIADDELWRAHENQRHRLVLRARTQHRETAALLGLGPDNPASGDVLDPKALTIGFARRFAGYKRATLLFRDLDRLARILNNPERPVQFIFAGKAHPRDEPAKQLIREVVQHSRRPEFRDRLVVLERYDVELARTLVQGADVWLNTPLRPLEASGTSGMKAVANGALHLSVLDGWWAEAYRQGAGWAIGGENTSEDPEVQDAFDAESLYSLIESEVVPLFYTRDADGIPRGWLVAMKQSIATFAPRFSTHRMVSEYALQAYTPAAQIWHQLRRENATPSRNLATWLARTRRGWDTMKINAVQDDAPGGPRSGQPLLVSVEAQLGALRPEDLRFDIVYGTATPEGDIQAERTLPMTCESVGADGVAHYTSSFIPAAGGRIGYTIRVLPSHPDLPNPLDTGLVYWA